MIQNDRHRVTGRSQVSVTCDKPECPESMYMPSDVGPQYAAGVMRELGWDISEPMTVPDRHIDPKFPARCPEHAQETEEHVHRYRREYADTVRCIFCGIREPG